jgi:hypothetical protein
LPEPRRRGAARAYAVAATAAFAAAALNTDPLAVLTLSDEDGSGLVVPELGSLSLDAWIAGMGIGCRIPAPLNARSKAVRLVQQAGQGIGDRARLDRGDPHGLFAASLLG